ncbi:hypothetical protein R1flu_015225 [Riccia fluitans]|uniref:EF-hand domain-containing protein n=1 Tax=Riccia fluitans TaxID=41844 RepID=A0ABD1YJF7_9MARC
MGEYRGGRRTRSLGPPLLTEAPEQAVGGYLMAMGDVSCSQLAPYVSNAGGATLLTSDPPSIRPLACRKIRNDLSGEERQEICMAFELFDSRKVGKLNASDLKVAMKALDFPVKKSECRKLIADYCKDGSDEIDQDEFTEIRMYSESICFFHLSP